MNRDILPGLQRKCGGKLTLFENLVRQKVYLVIWEVTVHSCFKLNKKLIKALTTSQKW